MSSLTIRMAGVNDDGALRRLAALDSARPLRGRVLVAESDGTPVAAVSLEAGAVTADPFQHSADAVRLLMLRRYQLLRQGGDAAPAQQLLRRLVPSPAR
jgi:ABC-type sugar transport system substrate-binding protein